MKRKSIYILISIFLVIAIAAIAWLVGYQVTGEVNPVRWGQSQKDKGKQTTDVDNDLIIPLTVGNDDIAPCDGAISPRIVGGYTSSSPSAKIYFNSNIYPFYVRVIEELLDDDDCTYDYSWDQPVYSNTEAQTVYDYGRGAKQWLSRVSLDGYTVTGDDFYYYLQNNRYYGTAENPTITINLTFTCKHTTVNTTVVSEPTCTEQGCTEKVCTTCGNKEIEYSPALGHDLSELVTSTENYNIYKCARCNLRVVSFSGTPTKEGYTFEGWYYGNGDNCGGDCRAYVGEAIYNDTELHAHFTINIQTVIYMSDGKEIQSEQVGYGYSANIFTPEKTGYTFTGWYLADGSKYENQFKRTVAYGRERRNRRFVPRRYRSPARYSGKNEYKL